MVKYNTVTACIQYPTLLKREKKKNMLGKSKQSIGLKDGADKSLKIMIWLQEYGCLKPFISTHGQW